MATVDSIDAFSLLQNMAPMSYDSSRLVDVACIAYAHVDDAHIKGLRGEFLPIVKKQFQVAAPIITTIDPCRITRRGVVPFCSPNQEQPDLCACHAIRVPSHTTL